MESMYLNVIRTVNDPMASARTCSKLEVIWVAFFSIITDLHYWFETFHCPGLRPFDSDYH